MHKISVVIHTFNNEKIIRECLDSVKDFDEIVICDMYSTDKTLEIAEEYGCKIVMHENIGWADPARNFAISHASNDWVLVVDSDERIPEKLKNYMYDFVSNAGEYTALRIPRLNYCWGQPLEVLYPDLIIRLFKKDVTYYPTTVHGTPVINSGKEFYMPTKDRGLAIIHTHTTSITPIINKLNKYTDLECEKMIAANYKLNMPYAIWKSIWLMFEKFTLKKGYKDGVRGAIQSFLFGTYKFLSFVKYWEYLNSSKTVKE